MSGFDIVYNFPLDGTETVTITQAPEYGSLEGIIQSFDPLFPQIVRWMGDYMPDQDYSGTDTIRYTVTNPINPNENGTSAEAVIIITINPVNDAPVLDELITLTLAEDSTVVVQLSAYDVDSNLLEYSVTESENINIALNGTTLTILPEANWNGSEIINITVLH